MADESPKHQMCHVDPFSPKSGDLGKIRRCGQGLFFLDDIPKSGKQHSLPKYSYTIEDLGIYIYIYPE